MIEQHTMRDPGFKNMFVKHLLPMIREQNNQLNLI